MKLQILALEWIPGGVRVRTRDVDNDADIKPIDVLPNDPAWSGKIPTQLQQAMNVARQGLIAVVTDYLGSDTPIRAAAAALDQRMKDEAASEAARAQADAAKQAQADAEAATKQAHADADAAAQRRAAEEQALADAGAKRASLEAEVAALESRKAAAEAIPETKPDAVVASPE